MGVADKVVEPVVAEVAAEVVEMVEVEVVEMVEVEAVTMTTTTTTRKVAPHPRPLQVFPDVYDNEIDGESDDELTGFSTTPRCNNNWPKSYKINVKRLQVDALRGSPPPTPSRRPTKTDDVLP